MKYKPPDILSGNEANVNEHINCFITSYEVGFTRQRTNAVSFRYFVCESTVNQMELGAQID